MITAFYNENDPHAASWLRQLCADNLITNGVISEQSITELQPEDLCGHDRVHLFAGIAGWELALQLAGWTADLPVWTGSCPCQPYSAAGKRKGNADERNLWPHMFRLIKFERPPCIFGEQVASAIGHGWLDGVFTDLEAEGYTCGAVVLGAHSAGAPHIRQRLFWVAYSATSRYAGARSGSDIDRIWQSADARRGFRERESAVGSPTDRLANTTDTLRRPNESQRGPIGRDANWGGSAECGGVGISNSDGCESRSAAATTDGHRSSANSAGGDDCRMEHSPSDGRGERRSESDGWSVTSRCGAERLGEGDQQGLEGRGLLTGQRQGKLPIGPAGAWSSYRLIHFRDGKTRRIESSIEPLVARLSPGVVPGCDSGLPIDPQASAEARVMRLRGYGNAIVPQVAAVFVRAVMEELGL